MDPLAELDEADVVMANQRYHMEAFKAALGIMNDLTSSNPCTVDEHGICTAHDHWGLGKVECPHARARRMLAKYASMWLK